MKRVEKGSERYRGGGREKGEKRERERERTMDFSVMCIKR